MDRDFNVHGGKDRESSSVDIVLVIPEYLYRDPITSIYYTGGFSVFQVGKVIQVLAGKAVGIFNPLRMSCNTNLGPQGRAF